jgi:hypothetical protein
MGRWGGEEGRKEGGNGNGESGMEMHATRFTESHWQVEGHVQYAEID